MSYNDAFFTDDDGEEEEDIQRTTSSLPKRPSLLDPASASSSSSSSSHHQTTSGSRPGGAVEEEKGSSSPPESSSLPEVVDLHEYHHPSGGTSLSDGGAEASNPEKKRKLAIMKGMRQVLRRGVGVAVNVATNAMSLLTIPGAGSSRKSSDSDDDDDGEGGLGDDDDGDDDDGSSGWNGSSPSRAKEEQLDDDGGGRLLAASNSSSSNVYIDSSATPSASEPSTPITFAQKMKAGIATRLNRQKSERELQEEKLRMDINRKLRKDGRNFCESIELNLSVCSWNVAQQNPPKEADIRSWVVGGGGVGSTEAAVIPPDLVVIGLQEVEFGGTALMLEVTESSVAWTEAVMDALHNATEWKVVYKKVCAVQLVGLVLIVISQAKHVPHIKNIKTSVTRTGAMSGVMGNKGSIGLRASVYGKRFLFINSHFHAHLRNTLRRHENYHTALSELKFYMHPDADDEIDQVDLLERLEGVSTTVTASTAAARREQKPEGLSAWSRIFKRRSQRGVAISNEKKLLACHDYVFFFGDLNYRLDKLTSRQIKQSLASKDYKALLRHDQLNSGMKTGVIFEGFSESEVHFAPTYKFDLGTDRYDTSPKQRDPAYTDRVLYRMLPSAPFTSPSSSTTGAKNAATTPSLFQSAGPTEDLPKGDSPSSSNGERSQVDLGVREVTEGDKRGTADLLVTCSSSGGNVEKGEETAEEEDTSSSSGDSHHEEAWSPSLSFAPGKKRAMTVGDLSSLDHTDHHQRKNSSSGKTKKWERMNNTQQSCSDDGDEEEVIDGQHVETTRCKDTNKKKKRSNASAGTPPPARRATLAVDGAQSHPHPSSSCPVGCSRFQFIPNAMKVISYDSFSEVRTSDHQPVSAQFAVDATSVNEEAINRTIFDIRQMNSGLLKQDTTVAEESFI